MARIIGTFSWEIQPGYPQLDGEKDAETITCLYIVPWDDVADNIPDYSDKFSDERFPWLSQFEHLELISRSVDCRGYVCG